MGVSDLYLSSLPAISRRQALGLIGGISRVSAAAASVPKIVTLQRGVETQSLINVQAIKQGFAAFWQTLAPRGNAQLCIHDSMGAIVWSRNSNNRFVDLITVPNEGFCFVSVPRGSQTLKFELIASDGQVRNESTLEFSGPLLRAAATSKIVAFLGHESSITYREWSGSPQRIALSSDPLQNTVVGGEQSRFPTVKLFPYGSGWIIVDQIRARCAELSDVFVQTRSAVLKQHLIQETISKQDDDVRASRAALEQAGKKGLVPTPVAIVSAAVDYQGGMWILPSPVRPSNVAVFKVNLDTFSAGETQRIELSNTGSVVGSRPPIMCSALNETRLLGYTEGVVVVF